MTSSYKIGSDFEKKFAKKTGATLTVASGSQWYAKMDARQSSLVFSLKRTEKETFTVKNDFFKELDRATKSPGSPVGALPAMCISVSKFDELVVMRLDDFVELLSRKEVEFKDPSVTKKTTKSELMRDIK